MRAGIFVCCLLTSLAAIASERLHVVIPAGPGGGLDGTARELGRVLVDLELAAKISFENVSGGGGGRAMGYFLENAARFEAPLLINSTPLVVRSLQGLFPYSFRDLTPVATLVADYGVFIAAGDPSASWPAVVERLRENPRAVTFGGGSVRGSLDHIVLAAALTAAGVDARRVRYLPYDGGGKALLALLGGEVDLLSTGLGETVAHIDAGQVHGLATTAPRRVAAIAGTPTLMELGYPLTFANWRGLFGPPGMSVEARQQLIERLRKMRRSAPWREVLKRRGWQQLDATGDAFTSFLETQEAQLATIMADLGFTPRARLK